MVISIYEVFELNRVLHVLLEQQISYSIQIAFKIHELTKWLDETENFLFERMHLIFGDGEIDITNPLYQAFLSSVIPFIETSLSFSDLLETEGDIKIDVTDIAILEKMLPKTE